MPSKSKTVLVLDLDDTLYKEADYVLSGFTHVAELIERLVGCSILGDILQFREREPDGDILEYACGVASLPVSVKESLLWAYRLHAPEIYLHPEVRRWLDKCHLEWHAIAIITDGRSISQRLKLKALGLDSIPAYISEEWQSTKLDQKRFLAIQERWQEKHYIYVGDNLEKDFLSPNLLGWTTVGLLNSGQNIHSRKSTKVMLDVNGTKYEPDFWVSDITEVDNIVPDE